MIKNYSARNGPKRHRGANSSHPLSVTQKPHSAEDIQDDTYKTQGGQEGE